MQVHNRLAQKIKNLRNLQKILKIHFQKTLLKLQSQASFSNNCLKGMAMVKQFFFDLESNYQTKSFFYYGREQTKNADKKVLYIYIATKLKLSGINYSHLEKQFLMFYQPGDLLITIGEEALIFANRQQIQSILHFVQDEAQLISKLTSLVYEYYLNRRVNQVTFIFNSDKLINNVVTILPINQFFLCAHLLPSTPLQITDYTIYPNLTYFLEQLGMIYLRGVITSLVLEASFYGLKQGLIKLQVNLTYIEQQMNNLQYELTKIYADKINEAIFLTSQNDDDDV